MSDAPLARRLPPIGEADPDDICDRFLDYVSELGIELYPAQEEALLEVLADNNVILNTPTGSGKSLIAEAMHFRAMAEDRRSFYTSPIKALVNEKFFALCDTFGPDSVGLLTGDASVIQVVVGGSQGGAHTCALLDSGAVRCWGYGAVGALGYGNKASIGDDETPASAGDVDVGAKVKQLVAGAGYSCALLNNGKVRCWGFGARGRLGYGNKASIGDDETPASAGDVDIGGPVSELAAGGRHTCALLNNGKVRCWGYGTTGALGYGNPDDVGDDESPASAGDVEVGGVVIQLSAGKQHTCAVLAGGGVKCWGFGYHGQLGLPDLSNQCTCKSDPSCCVGDDEKPLTTGEIDVGSGVVQVSAGRFHTCALLDTGKVRCWGSGGYGLLGYGNTNPIGDDEPPSAAGDVPLY
ncbi:hypothetical protein JYT22_00975 [Endomicrobium sp. AH-315-J14]|nr:hypothetical protein [Endomicrobium sp. AH-315-J14]